MAFFTGSFLGIILDARAGIIEGFGKFAAFIGTSIGWIDAVLSITIVFAA
jgi:hypothetical protein